MFQSINQCWFITYPCGLKRMPVHVQHLAKELTRILGMKLQVCPTEPLSPWTLFGRAASHLFAIWLASWLGACSSIVSQRTMLQGLSASMPPCMHMYVIRTSWHHLLRLHPWCTFWNLWVRQMCILMLIDVAKSCTSWNSHLQSMNVFMSTHSSMLHIVRLLHARQHHSLLRFLNYDWRWAPFHVSIDHIFGSLFYRTACLFPDM